MNTLTIVPAYGRDYQSAEAAERAWIGGKDFRIADIGSRFNGTYVGVRATEMMLSDGIEQVKIRFDSRQQFTLIDLEGTA